MSVSELATSPVASPGVPFVYGVDGRPVSREEAKELLADVELRTVHKTDLKLATGDWTTVRTLALVFDPDAWSGLVAPRYRPHVWGTALYTPAPENALLEVLATYDDRDLAVDEHIEAMGMLTLGTNSAQSEPSWACGLTWTGPEQ